jgi:flagellar hook assembly protein FlgD
MLISTVFDVKLEGNTRASTLALRVFSTEGRLIWEKMQAINESSLRSIQIDWDGKDLYGNRQARGMYYVEIVVKNKKGLASRRTGTILIH